MIDTVLSWLDNGRSVFEFVLALAAVWFLARKAATAAVDELEDKIITTIQGATKQIQIDANGGQSLSDVAKGLKAFREYQTKVNTQQQEALDKITERLDTENPQA